MQPDTCSTPTIARSDRDPMREAVRCVFQAAKADWGAKFTRQFSHSGEANAMTENAWCWRLLHRVDGTRPDCVIDGYERAVREQSPHMPTLVDIATAVRNVFSDALRSEQTIRKVAAPEIPSGSGISGVIDHLAAKNKNNESAQTCIAIMRDILGRPKVPTDGDGNERLSDAIAANDELLAKLPRHSATGEYKPCAVSSCGKAGSIQSGTNGNGPWFCHDHFRRT